ncbi:MAG: hypothetical protein CSA70_03630 [Rhodobacterales bacterium]|nr:MAG: hypothetical protein CSA70_03630 [Rhodobacterales bacterium]
MAKAPTRTSTVLDETGSPFKVSVLTEEQATPTSTGVRSVWADTVAHGLDPSRLASILKSANEGNNHDFLVLAEEMEERDGHYGSVLGQRKRAVSGIDPIVKESKEVPEDVSQAVQELIEAPAFTGMVDDCLDGIAKGYAAIEIKWHTTAERWTPAEYIRRDPRHFQFDTLTGRELRLREEGNDEGLELNKYGWIIHRPKLKSGLVVRGGLARLAMWAFMLKQFTLQDWAAFLEVFGMPLRLGKYDDGASPAEKRVLLRAVRDLGADAAAIIPKGMEVEFVESKGGSGNAVFKEMAEYLDKQVSKAVIGQTMTTDEGSSRAQSETHDEVRGDIKVADARQLEATINEYLIKPFVGLNWGWDVKAPQVSIPVEDPEDIEALTSALGTLVPLGFKVAQADVSDRMGFRVPDEGEAVLGMPATLSGPGKELARQTGQACKVCPGCGEVHLATAQNAEDPLVSEALEHWEADMEPIIGGVMAAAKASGDFEEFLARLDEMNPNMSGLAGRLAIQMLKARGDGDTDA